jgi:hypothetical protein
MMYGGSSKKYEIFVIIYFCHGGFMKFIFKLPFDGDI